MQREAAGGHTVVCGLERLGLRVTEALLMLGERVTVIADHPERRMLRRARGAGAKVVEGDVRDLHALPGVDLTRTRCIVLTDNSDLANLHAALAARDVNPDIRVVIRMFSADLAQRTNQLLARSTIISSSAEAAPHFAAAALGISETPTRRIWGRHFAVDEDEGDLAMPVASSRAARLLEALPRRVGSEPVPEQIDIGAGQVLIPIEEPPPSRSRRGRRLGRARMAARALVAFFDRRLAFTLLVLVVLVAGTAALFHAQGGTDWPTALLLTVSTAYGNADLSRFGPGLKVFEVVFMFASAAVLAMIFALVTDAVLGSRILEALGVPRGRMRDHVVVVGLGTVGYRLAQELLDAGVEVAAVDIRPQNRFISVARRQGIPVLVADGRYRDSLHLLSVETARVLAVVSDDDLVNLEAGLVAKELNPSIRVVARLFDPALADRAQRQLGIDVCRSVSALAAPSFVAAAVGDGVLSTLEWDGRLWLIAEVPVDAGSSMDGVAMIDAASPSDVRLLATRAPDGGRVVERWAPDGPSTLRAGDSILVACSRQAWVELRERALAPA